MPLGHPTNPDIVEFLRRHAALMELDGANAFRVRAYANAARVLGEAEVDAASMAAAGTLTSLDGVGTSVAKLVAEFIETGTASAHRDLLERVPAALLDLLNLPGLGVAKVKALFEATGIATLDQLEAACQSGALDEVSGFGRKTQQNLLKGIELTRRFAGQFRVHRAMAAALELIAALDGHPACEQVSVAGSLRRRREVVKDIDLVAATNRPGELSALLSAYSETDEVLARGDAKTSVRLNSGIQVDLRTVAPDHFPALLHHFTGSVDHNVALRARALTMGLRLNEYGLCRGEEPLPCADETELYRLLGLTYIPPEMREGLGEVAAAEADGIPQLVEEGDVRGILHVHTTFSDGLDELADMAEAVRSRGYQYLGISDHSKTAGYASGLKEDAAARQHDEIDALNAAYGDGFRIFKGIESDILRDGDLDYDDAFLERFDFVVASIHSPMNMPAERMTARIVRALGHPATTILAHPSGRLLLEREGYPMDMDQILEAAAAHGVAVEINAHPHRLDLDWRHIRKARSLGARFAINPDAHRIADLDNIGWGVGVARKGWLRAADVITCLDVDGIGAFFKAP